MTYECSDNKSLNKDRLNLDSMKDLSIDDIISLYRQDYILEGVLPEIESMETYGQACGTGFALDIDWSSVDQQGGVNLNKENAQAIKINPTSRCLESITFYSIKRLVTVGMYVEIRQDDGTGNKPLGVPGSSTGRLAEVNVPSGNIPTTFGNVTVDFFVLLPAADTPYWIVLRTSDHSCIAAATPRIELSQHWLAGRRRLYGYSEVFCAPAGCCYYDPGGDLVLPIASYKRTYVAPVLDTIAIAPTTATIGIGGTQQLTATCKDQYGNTITCPTLTWMSSNPSVATVNTAGLVTGVANGTTNITASGGGKTSNISAITVGAAGPTLASIIISPTTATIGINGTRQLSVTCRDQNNNVMTCPTLTWTSSNPSVTSISQTGLVTGITEGTADITASAAGKTSNTSTITVSIAPPAAGIEGALVIAAVAALGIAYFMMRKPPAPSTTK